jgi:phage terminase small subunit
MDSPIFKNEREMELLKYDLEPQEQLAVSLYLKSMNKTQAASDAGYDSPYVFNKPSVKAAIAEQLSIRAERLRVGGDWVLSELMRVYARCMQTEKELDRDGNPTGEFHFDAVNALKALNLIGKHVDVKAFDLKSDTSSNDEKVMEQLNKGRQRIHQARLEPDTFIKSKGTDLDG